MVAAVMAEEALMAAATAVGTEVRMSSQSLEGTVNGQWLHVRRFGAAP